MFAIPSKYSLTLPAARVAGNACHSSVETPIFNAATGAVVGRQEAACAELVDRAVCTGRTALGGWKATTPAFRGSLLRRIASLVEAEREALAALQMYVSGKPRAEAEADVGDVVATFSYYADLCEDSRVFADETLNVPNKAVRAARSYEAVGVAALIVPWNFPMVTTAWKLAPALAAGCTVVLKPSELTSPAEHALLDIVSRAGVPADVVNIVNGGADVGALLTQHPLIDKVSFTGSTAAGKKVMVAAAESMKRLTLELGGKSALIVREDADIDEAVSLAMQGAFANAGQMCSATSRILVHDAVYLRFMRALEQAVGSLVVAGPDASDSVMGPLISESQRQRVQAMLDSGLEQGARIAFSGQVAADAGAGFFLAPVVVALPALDNLLWNEEIFGPVACVRSFSTDEDAIAQANDTLYGLVATVITRDDGVTEYYRGRLRAGLVWINTPQLIFPQVEWGGLGLSGMGRELGLAGLRAYQESRHVVRGIRRCSPDTPR